MLKEERQNRILAHLQTDGRILAGDLSRRLAISDDTIRRDLRDLEDAGLLLRVHGGALPRATTVPEYTARIGQATDSKDAVAIATVKLLRHGQVILLDGGTSAVSVVEHLPLDFQATVITHSIPAMTALLRYPNIEVIMLGGRLFRSSQVAVGGETINSLRDIHADICVHGVSSVHPDVGISALDFEEAQVKRAMLDAADEVAVLAAGDKLGKVAPFVVAPMSRATYLVTEPGIDPEIRAAYQAVGVAVLSE